jgi:hypothetical protein
VSVQLWTSYEDARSGLATALAQERAFAGYTGGDTGDWILAVCDAWAALAEVISFYQQRILDEAFLATKQQGSSEELIYHSLGHAFPPNATATTTLAYHLESNVAGVEAVSRLGSASGTGMSPQTISAMNAPQPPAAATTPAPSSQAIGSIPGLPSVGSPAGITPGATAGPTSPLSLGTASNVPAAAQVRAIPSSDGKAPVFVTTQALGAYVGASRLAANTKPVAPRPLSSATTLLELAGTQTGLAVGQPVLITAAAPAGGTSLRWIRLLTDVHPDAKRGSTRIGWERPLGSGPEEPSAAGVINPVVFGFSRSSGLVAAGAPQWSAQTLARQLQTTTAQGQPLPIRGGFASSEDAGVSWTLHPAGLPLGVDLSAVGAYGEVAIVSAGASGLLRSVGGQPFAPTTLGGGSRRPVGFLGGTATRMLAGASSGVVYESLDQGQTWSAVTGGPPQLVPAPTVPASPPAPPTQTVTSHQLPSAAVRCVIEDPDGPSEDPGALVAGTDAGLYSYAHGNWRAVPDAPGQPAAFALLLRADGTLALGSSGGVFIRTDGNWSSSPLGGLSDAVYLLAEMAGDLYAATSNGLQAYVEGVWQAAGQGLPTGISINALLSEQGTLLAATDEGIYRSARTPPTMTWSRCDHVPAFTVPGADVPAAAPAAAGTAPGAGLLAAFADYGIELSSSALITASAGGHTLTDAGHSYGLTPTDSTSPSGAPWQVTLLDAMPVATGLAQPAGGPVLAVGSAASSAANQWPGFEVAGTSVEIAPPVRAVAPGAPAIIEQRTSSPLAAVLDITALEQDSALRAAKTTPLTRLHFRQSLTTGQFPRRTSTVWTGATVLALFDPPFPVPQQVGGATIELAAPLSAPVQAGQLAALTGSPPGWALAPLGGAVVIPPTTSVAAATTSSTPSVTPVIVGPPEADLSGVAVAQDGTVYLAGAEGVFKLAAAAAAAAAHDMLGQAHAQLLSAGWPGGASAAVTVAGDTVLAGSSKGVQRLVSGSSDSAPSWTPVGPGGDATLPGGVLALTGDGTRAVASFSDGSVLVATDAAEQPASWTAQPKLSPPASTLAISGTTLYATNTAGVFVLSGGKWHPLPAGAIAGPYIAMQIDARGMLWTGGPAGLQSYDPGPRQWRREPQIAGPVQALCLRPSGVMSAAALHDVGDQQGTEWNPVSESPAATISAIAGAPDGSLWIATRAWASLVPQTGMGELEIEHRPLVADLAVSARDVESLSQGAAPDALLAALADAGEPLDASHAVTTADGTGCWLIRSGSDLYIVAQRTDAQGSTINVYLNETVVYPTGPPGKISTATAWPVLAGGIAATLAVQESRIIQVPADADAPSLAETATIAGASADLEAGSVTLGSTSTLTFQQPLAHIYDASTMQVNLNVVSAAAGQPVSRPIGSGDPQQANQTFEVPFPIAAIGATASNPSATPTSSLSVYVDGQPWTAVSALNQAGPADTVYVERDNLDGSATVTFGDGVHGARLPAGQNNVIATYLQGGGPDTEVAPGALIQALDRPQLVTAVHNPAPALLPPMPDPDQARTSAVRGLDRVVTLEDYEDLALAQPNVSSARGDIVAGPLGRAIVITVALAPNAPPGTLEAVSAATEPLGPSGLPVRFVTALPKSVLASVQIVSKRASGTIEPAVRAALTNLSARRPGDPLYASQVLSAAVAVPGVIAARIIGWEIAGDPTITGPALAAAPASWGQQDLTPTGAQLLAIDGAQHYLVIEVVAPRR